MFSDGGTMVSIDFSVDKDDYTIIRYKDHSKYKTDLKIYVNGEDKSGKGIRDSQKLLESYLPDLTSSLLGSVVVLGQGLPQRFTNNSPSGRKEVLEKLSKSDFMIEDLKNRITNRKSEVQKQLRDKEDAILVNEAKIKTLQQQIKSSEDRLSTLENPSIYSDLISRAKRRIEELSSKIDEYKNLVNDSRERLSLLQQQLSITKSEYNDRINSLTLRYNDIKNDYQMRMHTIYSDKLSAESRVKKAKDIRDTCPTCGRKFENVFIPNTEEDERLIYSLSNEHNTLKTELDSITLNHNDEVKKVNDECTRATESTQREIMELSAHLFNYECAYGEFNKDRSSEENSVRKYETMLSTYEATVQTIQQTIKYNTEDIKKLEEEIVYTNVSKNTLEDRISVINKFNTMITRDFRGYLLKNVIKYIDDRAKEYCEDVFGTRELFFVLEGNNIDIKYCGKYMESLSGGEKQKIDLIIQFAIRDMLCQFLDFRSNIIALDEIFDALDSVSCDKVVELISKKLSDIDSVFIITHHKELGIPADSTITVTKHGDGVSTVC